MKKILAYLLTAAVLTGTLSAAACADEVKTESTVSTESTESTESAESKVIRIHEDTIPDWTADSEVMKEIVSFVTDVTDESSDSYLEPEARIAVFDFDGTLFGERFPYYIDHCLLLYRVLHDDSYTPSEETRAFALETEEALLNHTKAPGGSAGVIADAFKGLTVEEYMDYVRAFLEIPAWGFEGMAYGEGFFRPMVSLVQYLAEHDFVVYISSGSERQMLRTLIEDELGEWIPPEQAIGSTLGLTVPGQGDTADRDYNMEAGEQVVLSGKTGTKNLQVGKVYGIINEIGRVPVLAFGNSSGDLSMGQYAVDNGGKAFMLLCDDEERDYGDVSVAEKFKTQCEERGFATVSMKNDFATIYGEAVVKVEEEGLDLAA